MKRTQTWKDWIHVLFLWSIISELLGSKISILYGNFKIKENKYRLQRAWEVVAVYHEKLDELNNKLIISKLVGQRKKLSGNTQNILQKSKSGGWGRRQA